MNTKLHLFLPIVCIFISLNVHSKCNFSTSAFSDQLNDLNNISSLELKINKSKKWSTNLLKAILDKTANINKKRKKRFNGTVRAIYPFGFCEHKAKVRIHGDWKDHLSMDYASLDIRLIEGNIANMVKFKLLLPETRHSDAEIVITSLMHEIDIIAPKTRFIDVKLNNKANKTFLFQEKIAKELLESNNRKEGPIFEGDESIMWTESSVFTEIFKNEPISLSRQLNTKWKHSNTSAYYISAKANQSLQKSYLISRASKSRNFMKFLTNYNNDQKKIWQEYYLLMLASKSIHGLTLTNSKFYWDTFSDSFQPIYYDGNAYFFKSLDLSTFINKNEYKNHLIFLNDFDIDSFVRKLSLIVNNESFIKKLQDKGVAKNISVIESNLLSFINNLLLIKKKSVLYNKNQYQFESEADSKKIFLNLAKKLLGDKNIIIAKDIIDKEYSFNYCVNKFLCDIPKKGTYEGVKKIINNNYFVDYSFDIDNISPRKAIFSTLLNSDIYASQNIDVSENFNARTIVFEEKLGKGWVLLKNVNVNNINFIYKGHSTNNYSVKSTSRFNKYGLTGCLNFYNATFNNSSIEAFNTKCEDAVNIINSNGNINSVKLSNTESDGLDIDFSKITLLKLDVKNSGNDCIDISSGIYKFNEIIANNCTDKGFSIGESSKVSLKKVNIMNSSIGIAVKDSSKIKLDNFYGKALGVCISAYNKKQEFRGGEILIEKYECVNQNKNIEDEFSRITIR
jgi:hypothetical protein